MDVKITLDLNTDDQRCTKIVAIKAYRDAFDCGLHTAKDNIEEGMAYVHDTIHVTCTVTQLGMLTRLIIQADHADCSTGMRIAQVEDVDPSGRGIAPHFVFSHNPS